MRETEDGFKIAQENLKIIYKKVMDETLRGADKDQKLAIGCLTTCKVKDVRDIVSLLLRESRAHVLHLNLGSHTLQLRESQESL